MQAAVEQAAVLDAAPILKDGTLSLDASTMAGGAFVWIEVEQDGLYTISLDVPGALVLGSIPTVDGKYDGTTSAQQHASSLSQDESPSIGPVLLSTVHPYLLSASSKAGAGSVSLALDQALAELTESPEKGANAADGDTLYSGDGTLNLVLQSSPQPRRIEVIAEPRAKLSAKLARQGIPAGGLYPWLDSEDASLVISATTTGDSAPSRVLLRVAPADEAVDETEPNQSEPNTITVDSPFDGYLLPGDEDHLGFSLDQETILDLAVNTSIPNLRYQLSLYRDGDSRPELLLERTPTGSLTELPLQLVPGQYRLVLERSGDSQAVAYTASLTSNGASPAANQEIEPNDRRITAMPLSDSLRVSGQAAEDDIDVYKFSVPGDKAGHLWRVFTLGAERIQLFNDEGKLADVRATGRRTSVDSLALEPEDHWVQIHAEADYVLRVMDLGPRPEGFEGEPNDKRTDGQRLELGEGVRGGFHRADDLDYYLFRLDASSAIEITIKPVDDGKMDVKLYIDRNQYGTRADFTPGSEPYTFSSTLPAGDWTLVVRAQDAVIQGQYEITVRRLPALTDTEPDNDPLDAAKLPRDGDISSSVGAFDDKDQIFIPLPEGEGTTAFVCTHTAGGQPGRWRLYHWSDASRIADLRQGIAIFDYGPDLGGAIRFGLDATSEPLDYHCALRFPPLDDIAFPASPPQGAEENLTLATGETRSFVIAADGPEPSVKLQMAAGEIGFLSCVDSSGTTLPPATRIWELHEVSQPVSELLGDYKPFVAQEESLILLRRVYAKRHGEGTLPMQVTCHLLGVDGLPRPVDMGPPAPVVVFEQMAAAATESETGEPGPPPPGLEALINRKVPDQQPQGDLPVTIGFAELPELAAFNDAGQRFDTTISLTSEAASAITAEVAIEIEAEGWRADLDNSTVTLQAGKTTTVQATIEAPPWLSPSLRPGLLMRADANGDFAAGMIEIPLSATAIPKGPFTYWHAPDGLRGGLNILHYGLGARLTTWGDAVADESKQRGESALHDGIAPHVASVNVPKTIAFELAAEAAVAGVMIQLRSTIGAERWPAEMLVSAPAADGSWERIGATRLKTVHAPQYLVFDSPVTTNQLKFEFPRCLIKCNQVYIQDIQAISMPGTHPEGLPPINAADPELGGHVVWSTDGFGGYWNSEFLVGAPEAHNRGWPRQRPGEPLQVTVSFHQNRAALIDSIVWVGDPDDTSRISAARVEASVSGPGGPWVDVGLLTAPPLGELRSKLDFYEPHWVRYLRLTFPLDQETPHLGPDAFEVFEVPGTSVLGLWEDDIPRAAYEAVTDAVPAVPVPPIGGPSRDVAKTLPIDNGFRSSVVIERNEDWWRFSVPEAQINRLTLEFERDRPIVVVELFDNDGAPVSVNLNGGQAEAILTSGQYFLRIFEPPRSVVISWDTSGSVAHYIPRTLAAVRTWGRSLQPGRDALQLLPFGSDGFLLQEWAETPEALEVALSNLQTKDSSDSETAMLIASEGLAMRDGARGIVIMTDAETSMNKDLWPALLEADPRVVALSVDSDARHNAAVMMDWANSNNGRFQRVIGPLGLADSMEMANALFRAPKAYGLTASLEELVEPDGEASVTISAIEGVATVSGAVELILDASGSMLQRMEGRRRIDIAHDALSDLVSQTLPQGMPFAFRAFGLEEDACRSDLVIPLGPLDRETAQTAIRDVPAINLAKTAIADSLLATAEDLAEATPPLVVVLVTDGEETCEGDPEAAIAQLRESGLDARINIVGFAIDDAGLAETFSNWAEAGGGTYFDASGAEALEQSIADALKPRFDVTRLYLDGREEVVARIALGESVTVPAGRLLITPGSGASGDSIRLDVQVGGNRELKYAPSTGLTESE